MRESPAKCGIVGNYAADLIRTAYAKVQTCFDKLEGAEDAFIEVSEVDIETNNADEWNYLDEPTERYEHALSSYIDCLKKATEAECALQQSQSESLVQAEDVKR